MCKQTSCLSYRIITQRCSFLLASGSLPEVRLVIRWNDHCERNSFCHYTPPPPPPHPIFIHSCFTPHLTTVRTSRAGCCGGQYWLISEKQIPSRHKPRNPGGEKNQRIRFDDSIRKHNTDTQVILFFQIDWQPCLIPSVKAEPRLKKKGVYLSTETVPTDSMKIKAL